MNEFLRVYEWLATTLKADATLMANVSGVFAGAAPEGTAPVYVVFNWQGGADVTEQAGHRIMNNSLYQVKAVGPADQIATLKTVADRIDALLQRASGSTSDATVLWSERERPVALDNTVNGVLWTNVGGLYRIYAQAA